MLSTFAQWRAQTRHELTEVGTEVDVDGVLECRRRRPAVRVRGRVDRLERDGAGRLVVVDVKTGKTPVSKDDAQRHAQLAMYQLAIAEGLLPQGDSPGGGRLVYLGRAGAAGPTERQQDALTPDVRGDWRELVRKAAAATKGPQFVARVNDGCAHCPVTAELPRPGGGRRNGAHRDTEVQSHRIGLRPRSFRSDRRAGGGHRRTAGAAGGDRGRGRGQDRDDGRPGGVAGGQRLRLAR